MTINERSVDPTLSWWINSLDHRLTAEFYACCFSSRLRCTCIMSYLFWECSGFVITTEPLGFALTKEVNVFLLRVQLAFQCTVMVMMKLGDFLGGLNSPQEWKTVEEHLYHSNKNELMSYFLEADHITQYTKMDWKMYFHTMFSSSFQGWMDRSLRVRQLCYGKPYRTSEFFFVSHSNHNYTYSAVVCDIITAFHTLQWSRTLLHLGFLKSGLHDSQGVSSDPQKNIGDHLSQP